MDANNVAQPHVVGAISADRELLELAANAAGYSIAFDDGMSASFDDGIYYTHDRGYPAANRDGSNWWNPLLDDGDALRLAVKLGIGIYANLNRNPPEAQALIDASGMLIREPLLAEDHRSGIHRAIVRAAAEIRQAMLS